MAKFDDLIKHILSESPAPAITPEKPTVKPGTKPETPSKPSKPEHPFAPKPGIKPRPDAKKKSREENEENADVKLFLSHRRKK
jgi:hypothetical protein